MAPKGRSWSHTTTLEKRPDMISQAFTNKRYEPAACEWQVGTMLDVPISIHPLPYF